MVSGGDVVINTPKTIARMAKVIRAAGVLPELQASDSGDIRIAHELIGQGVLEGPRAYSIVMGIRYGFPASPETLLYARGLLPGGCHVDRLRHQPPVLPGGRLVGDHGRPRPGRARGQHYLARGRLAPSNAALVERARTLVELLGGTVATAAEARTLFEPARYASAARGLSPTRRSIQPCARPRTAKAPDIDHLGLGFEGTARHREAAEALVKVASAGVNPSDVKAVLGAMPHAVWPRTPGRDYAGTVVNPPAEWVGKEVWGSGGELGIRRDGTHADLSCDRGYPP